MSDKFTAVKWFLTGWFCCYCLRLIIDLGG